MTLWHCDSQEVLEKFEFFPIKCRILRTAERYHQYLEDNVNGGKDGRKLKTKVLLDSCLAQPCRAAGAKFAGAK